MSNSSDIKSIDVTKATNGKTATIVVTYKDGSSEIYEKDDIEKLKALGVGIKGKADKK